MFLRISFLLVALVLLSSCAMPPDSPRFQPSGSLPRHDQPSFDEYVRDTHAWIADNRAFIGDDRHREIALNAPFERRPDTPEKRGILFVHGLGSSPWYFTDMANAMAEDGWLVRSILLPGHGSRPADLMLPAHEDWEDAVAHHTQLLANEVDELWLGGFSTGGNLVTAQALKDDRVEGLLLFSPGFYPDSQYLFLAPAISYFWDWLDIDDEDNIATYQSLPSRGAALYYRSVSAVQKNLEAEHFDKPVLMTMSQHDSVLDPAATLDAFQTRFPNPKSRFVWYGDTPPHLDDPRITALTSYLPERRISNFSHMNVLFAPENPYYGEAGSYTMLENGQEDLTPPDDPDALWFSAWGQQDPEKYHARLTWNPYFDELLDDIREVTGD
ncbi:alpha/beta hydrolase [Vreelandella gomseomensis]|uniref:Alpha/beta fold hydrolase n=1 Tax=Vreelandella gomseomensis TaxID=370766 RepID=A0ABU1GFN2_9GAMM|nr:alpha/beta fold hydrolase [Halomonas gomseomensis]MDR5876281.1 alpha/beta fold hydrolase [Halomonas gomseomensis]